MTKKMLTKNYKIFGFEPPVGQNATQKNGSIYDQKDGLIELSEFSISVILKVLM